MCSLAVLLRESARYPLIIAANRDESRTRPTRAPFLWETSPRILAGRDEREGGTWMGLNEHGLFVGLTNLWGHREEGARRASRGQLVLRVLASRGIDEGVGRLEGEDPEATNPFLLVCADRAGRGFWTSTTHALQATPLDAGVHAFGNLLPGDPAHRKAAGALRTIGAAWEAREGDEPGEIVTALARPLRQHVEGGEPGASLCVHTGGEYGTVSSSIVLAGTDAASSRFLYSPGPPCVTSYADCSGLLAALWKEG